MSVKGIKTEIEDLNPELDVVKFYGDHKGFGLKILIVVSRFNGHLTGALVQGASDCLTEHGVLPEDITVVAVPGAFEIPSAIAAGLTLTGLTDQVPDAVIACGVVLEGATIHAQMIAQNVPRALINLGTEFSVPVIDCVVAANDMAQAEERCLSGKDSRGWYSALAALEMARVFEAMTEVYGEEYEVMMEDSV